ncbi:MAG: M3 family oligoendopeptidase, partial [Anaerolineales bacterium]|nr:M3 family oligoendopeptidase [Anaerolineales bacterium]
DFMNMSWEEIEPIYEALKTRDLNHRNVEKWLKDWSSLRELISERYARLQLATSLDTQDEEAEEDFHIYLDEVFPPAEAADQVLKEKLLASGLRPDGMEIPLKKMRVKAELFREENLPLLTEEYKLGLQYNKVFGAQSVEWKGEERTLVQLKSKLQTPERKTREELWRLLSERQLEDREKVNEIWGKLMEVRLQLAENADKEDYRDFSWQKRTRLDYEPADSLQFVDAVEEVVVPAAARVYDRYQERMGLERLRPWDVINNRSTMDFPVLKAFETEDEFTSRVLGIYRKLDPKLGKYFDLMREENLLDLVNRQGKGPGAFCTSFPTQKRPFIFMNAVGLATDVRTLFHESGHAFHVFERTQLPYIHQWHTGLEFGEVASTAMELLTSRYIPEGEGGFFTEEESARYRRGHLENKLLFWPYMAVVVAFQHWVYQHHQQASDPASCDQKWSELVDRFLPAIDWDDLQDVKETGWQRKLHIHRAPFYYIEYGLSLLGAVQLWENALNDERDALRKYRQSLGLGGTASLPDLYAAAGVKFAFDAETLGSAIDLIEGKLQEFEAVI